jgi:hypothetical protein
MTSGNTVIRDRSSIGEHYIEDNKPQYEALSYVWGSAENHVNIHSGHSGEILGVTQSLATGLPYPRYEDKPRRL